MSKLYFRSAAMNAGKSTALLQVAHNCGKRGLAVLLFTAAHDDRAGAGQIGSRLGLVRPAASLGADTEFNRARLQALAGGPVGRWPVCWSMRRSSSAQPRCGSCTAGPMSRAAASSKVNGW